MPRFEVAEVTSGVWTTFLPEVHPREELLEFESGPDTSSSATGREREGPVPITAS